MSKTSILHEVQGRILMVSINRPEVRNALDIQSSRTLRTIFEDFRDDPELWVAILTGAGSEAFCAGADLKEGASMTDEELARVVADPPVFGGITRQFEARKPIIAAVNGAAAGGGTEIALACDLVVAADTATFSLPEPLVGRVPAAGGMHRLVRQIPLKPAMGMLLTGAKIDAHEAFRLQLVNEVVPAAEVLGAARRWAAQVLRCSPTAIRTVMESVAQGMDAPSVDAALEADTPWLAALRASHDYREGPRAFVEKRAPNWHPS